MDGRRRGRRVKERADGEVCVHYSCRNKCFVRNRGDITIHQPPPPLAISAGDASASSSLASIMRPPVVCSLLVRRLCLVHESQDLEQQVEESTGRATSGTREEIQRHRSKRNHRVLTTVIFCIFTKRLCDESHGCSSSTSKDRTCLQMAFTRWAASPSASASNGTISLTERAEARRTNGVFVLIPHLSLHLLLQDYLSSHAGLPASWSLCQHVRPDEAPGSVPFQLPRAQQEVNSSFKRVITVLPSRLEDSLTEYVMTALCP
ncbi:hypothetical protein GBF38_011985 [Nibea albiflora]|uniref:Uncharacterized protein n=1 Tax=Nibea albiflora TaxID=240163 RepID=A0ACB7EIU7_NIBAL|nr:hypothetical protein GBF38_011985 [Nibea albiflora]